jgi:two-component system, NarL family, sensor histidine kinase BarA
MDGKQSFLSRLNIKKQCDSYRVSLWECPQFLFLIMGFVIVVTIVIVYILSIRYSSPEFAALAVLAITGFLFIIGHLVFVAFERMAHSAVSKSEFLSIMSHQLRSPLSAIKWQMNVLLSDQEKIGTITPMTRGYFERVNEENERMIRTVNDLLIVNHIDDNKLVLRSSELSLGDITKKMVNRYNHFSEAQNVELSLVADDNLPHVIADEERLNTVLTHLIDNALRYSPGGGTVRIRIIHQGAHLQWSISDHGIGIPNNEHDRVFEKFYRSKEGSRFQAEGSGIGLYIVKSIIELMGGSVGFVSLQNKGSTFLFTLPIIN